MEIRDRFRGSLLGLAVGDALGTTVETMPRGSFEPMTDIVGGGKFRLLPGQVSVRLIICFYSHHMFPFLPSFPVDG